jgi:hypothetical protein
VEIMKIHPIIKGALIELGAMGLFLAALQIDGHFRLNRVEFIFLYLIPLLVLAYGMYRFWKGTQITSKPKKAKPGQRGHI